VLESCVFILDIIEKHDPYLDREKCWHSMCNLYHQPICQPLALSTFGCQHCLQMLYLLLWLVLSWVITTSSISLLVMFELFDGSYFEHALFNLLIWITFNNKITHGFKYASIKSLQVDVQKFNILSKNIGQGVASLGKACVNFGLRPKKFNMFMKKKYKLFFHFFLSNWTLLNYVEFFHSTLL
jgi:hypothetical protein